MPPKKRPGEPLADRAVRTMLALRDALGDVVSLLEQASGPVPMAALLLADVARLMPQCGALLDTAPILHVEAQWLPDDMVRLILDFALFRRRRSQWGALGADGVPTILSWMPHGWEWTGTSVQKSRLVCKAWARIVGSMVCRLHTRASFRVKPEAIVAAFPLVDTIRVADNIHFKKTTATFARLVDLYMQRDRVPIILDDHRNSNKCAIMDARGAYANAYGYPLNFSNTAIPTHVRCCIGGGAHAWICTNTPLDAVAAAFGNTLPVFVSGFPPIVGGGFRAPVVVLQVCDQLERDTSKIASLLDPARWIGGHLPRVVLDVACYRHQTRWFEQVAARVRVARTAIAPHPFSIFTEGPDQCSVALLAAD